MQFERKGHSSRGDNVLYVKVFEANFDSGVLQQSCVFATGEQGFVNVLASCAYHVPRAEGECSGFGVLYADSHGCKFRGVEIAVDEFLRDVSKIQVGETEGECSHTILHIDLGCLQLGGLEFGYVVLALSHRESTYLF